VSEMGRNLRSAHFNSAPERSVAFGGAGSSEEALELWHDMIPVEQDRPVLVRHGWGACYATA